MRLGVHLPLADLGNGVPDVNDLRDYVVAARNLGFSTVSANDHLVWSHPWLDGTTALASVAATAGDMTLATVSPLTRERTRGSASSNRDQRSSKGIPTAW